jgi:hypothetical protein
MAAVRLFDASSYFCHHRKMDTAKLTIRLRDERLYGLLKLLAAQRGISMNQMVEQALARELEREADRAEGELTESLERLRSYRGDPGTLAREFADAEAAEPDPLRSEPRATHQRVRQAIRSGR